MGCAVINQDNGAWIMESKLHKETLYDQLKARLIDLIRLENPRMLPSEKDLIERYGVSRNTVRKAIQDLCDDGVLKTVHGLGTLVLNPADKMGKGMILVIRNKETHPFQQHVLDELLYRLNDYRLNSMLAVVNKEEPDLERLEFLISKADGVIMDQMASYAKDICEMVENSKKRRVYLRCRPSMQGVPFVSEDLECGFRKIVEHLVSLGHRRIAYLGNMRDAARMNGISKALSAASLSLEPDNSVHFENGTRASGYLAAGELLARKTKFSAVIAHNDSAALGAMERFMIAGLRIPGDISMTGFDNLPDSKSYPVPLTTCGGDVKLLVDIAITRLLENKVDRSSYETRIEPELEVRDSTGPV